MFVCMEDLCLAWVLFVLLICCNKVTVIPISITLLIGVGLSVKRKYDMLLSCL